jgi:PAS domain S-box-containing protein
MENKLIVNNLPEPVFTINEQGLVLFCNSSAESCFGTDGANNVGRQLKELLVIDPDPDEDLFAMLANIPIGSQLEKTVRRRDGQVVPFEFILTPAGGEDTSIRVLFARDISERWVREQKLNHSYQNQRIMNSILQISLMPISLDEQLEFILDQILAIPTIDLLPNGAILLVNGDAGVLNLKAQRGFSAQQLDTCGKVPFGKCHCGRAALSGEIQFVKCIDESHDFVFASMKPHGHYCVPIVADSEVLGVVALYIKEGHQSTELETETLQAIANVLAGIIERKKMEGQLVGLIDHLKKTVTELDEERKFNESVIASLGSGLLVLDRNGVIEKSNPAGRVLLNRLYSDDLEGEELGKIFGSQVAEEMTAGNNRANEEGRREIKLSARNGGLDIIIEYATVSREDVTGAQVGKIISFSDVTGLKKIQAEMEKMNRFSTIAEIASAVAHEVRNPLAGIRTMSQVIDEQLAADAPHKEYTRRIIKQVDRLNELLTDFFTYARPPVPKRRQVPLRRIIEEIKPLVHSRLTKNKVTLLEEYEERLPDIFADPSQIQQVFLNLFLNSLAALRRDDGKIAIKSSYIGTARNSADLDKCPWLRPDIPYVTVYFSDNGSGMDPEVMEKIFEPFFTTRHDGSGLGLSIVYRILKENDAGIVVKSEPGQGTTFIIFFSTSGASWAKS